MSAVGRGWRSWEILAVMAWVLLFYHPLLNPFAMQSGGDAANLFWPIKLIMREAIWHHGVVPLWNPWAYMGAPLAASLQHAVYYPPDWLLYAALPAHIAMNLGNVMHLLLAGVGAWAWLRIGHRLEALPAIACGAAFPCVAWFWGQQEHINQLAAISWMPLQACLVLMYIQGRISTGAFARWWSLCAAFQFFTGHPQEAFYAHLFCGLYTMGLLLFRAVPLGETLRRITPGFLWGGILAGLLVAVQLLPTLELNTHSRRQFRDPTYAISFSMPPDLLLTHFQPHRFGSFANGYYLKDQDGNPVLDEAGNPGWDRRAYGEYGVYIGLPLLLLALVGLLIPGTFPRRQRILLLCIANVATLLALGGNTDPRRLLALDFTEFPQPGWSLHELFLRIIPPAQGFRVPARIVLLASFCLVTLAAVGLQGLLRLLPQRTQIINGCALGIAIFAALYIPSRKEKYHHPVPVEPMITQLSLWREDTATLDARVFRMSMSDDGALVAERHLQTTFADGNPLLNRMAALQPHMNAPARIPTVDGYEEGLVPTARMKDFLYHFNRNFRQFRPDAEFLALLGVSRVYTELPVDESVYTSMESAAATPRFRMQRNPIARGAAVPASALAGIDFTNIDGPFWRGGQPHPEIYREEIKWGNLNPAAWQSAATLTTTVPNLNQVDIHGTTNENAILSLGWYPGWINTHTGSPIDFISAVHAEVELAPEGITSLRFQPHSHLLGLFLTALGIMLWVYTARRNEG